jgi:hypothetical protein
MLRVRNKTMTFADMCGEARRAWDVPPDARLNPSFVRSLRRAFHSMVKDGILLTTGSGRPGDPYRYYIHPLMRVVAGEQTFMPDDLAEMAAQAVVEPRLEE